MKKNILLFLTPLLFLIKADIQADPCCNEESSCADESSFYTKILAGVNFLQNTHIDDNKTTYKAGYIVAGSLGYYWGDGLRTELEYAYRRNTISKIQFYLGESATHGHFQTSSCMANLLWDVPLCSWGQTFWNTQPFIGGGIGYDFQQMHASNSRFRFKQNWNHFSWQLMAGLVYPIFCNTEATLEYKYHQGGCNFYNHSIGIGLTYKFGLPSW